MTKEDHPADRDREIVRAVEVSSLRDEIETLTGRIRRTAGSGLVLTMLFVVGGAFMEQSGTLWFLGALWLFFVARLGVLNRTAGRELRLKESELALLTVAPSDPTLPDGL